MEIEFPLEFLVFGTPVSAGTKNPDARDRWKSRVKEASGPALPDAHWAADARLAATLYYFPDQQMQGDVDNIVKYTLDGMSRHIYLDDSQIDRVVVQKFEPGAIYQFNDPSERLLEAVEAPRPVLYIELSTDIYGELK